MSQAYRAVAVHNTLKLYCLGVEQGLCIQSYGETTDNWQVSERKKMVWSSHQPGVGHITGEAMVPGLHRWTL